MDKFIIELPDNTAWVQWVRVAEDGTVCFDYKYPEDLMPYTEPDLEQVRKESCDKCMNEAEDLAYQLYGSKVDEAYQRGLENAWRAARKIDHMADETIKEIFGCGFSSVFEKYTASEAIEKIKAYEQKEQESITAEDVMRQYLSIFCKGRSCIGCSLNTPDFTCGRGKHFLHDCVSNEEVRKAYATVLQKMKES